MATSNFQVWNPNQTNQETDAGYAADSLRSGGAPVNAICPSPTFNKFAYQQSIGIAALMQMMANKGFNVSDSDFGILTAVLANLLTSADVKTPMITVPFNTTLVLDCSAANGFQVTLSGSVSSLTISHATFGQIITVAFTQNATGGYTVPWPANVKSPGFVGAAANWTYMQQFQVLGDGQLHPLAPMTVS